MYQPFNWQRIKNLYRGKFMRADVKKMNDEEILKRLSEIGISISIPEFKEAALHAGRPSKLIKKWEPLIDGIGLDKEDFIYEAVIEFWKRYLKNVRCPELVRHSFEEIIDYYEEFQHHNRDTLLGIYGKINTIHQEFIKDDGTPDTDFYIETVGSSYHDIEGFLLELPFELARLGLIDEAINIGRWFSALSSQPENFYRDMGCILAEAGRKEEALKQIEENLKMFPDDIWVVINAGDALYTLGEPKAEEYFLKAYEMAGDNKYDKEGALDRLIDFYKWQGDKEKVQKFEEEFEKLVNPPPPPPRQVINKVKIGRNEPCPCGSGKKYKKCCLNKEN
jgi:tetratricopeptide (TPR) repeat protein